LTAVIDNDEDGFTILDGDCNETDPNSHPGESEICDGRDNDCDGHVPAAALNHDADGYRVCNDDCNNYDNTMYPEAPELCDGKDNDCDGIIPADETDQDSDGYRKCEGDSNDNDSKTYPGASVTQKTQEGNKQKIQNSIYSAYPLFPQSQGLQIPYLRMQIYPQPITAFQFPSFLNMFQNLSWNIPYKPFNYPQTMSQFLFQGKWFSTPLVQPASIQNYFQWNKPIF